MPLAQDLSAFVYGIRLEALPIRVIGHAKTIILDALACIVAGAESPAARIAMKAVSAKSGPQSATIAVHGIRATAAYASLVNGAMLRSQDWMDVYVSRDVCHPSEIIPTAMACAESAGASGQAFLEAVIAGLTLHMRLADALPLHQHGLHHAGHAAWVVPLVAGRLLAESSDTAANTITVTAPRFLVPEGFARGQLANLKGLAYALLAREAIETVELAKAGLKGSSEACEEVLRLLSEHFRMQIRPEELVLAPPTDLSGIALKMYPAQYALQPLVAAACRVHAEDPQIGRRLRKIVVRASRRTVERTADAAKYAPKGPEAADHSLPFCVAVAFIEGHVVPSVFEARRWNDPEISALMTKIVAVPVDETPGYEVGRQEIELSFVDGTKKTLACQYPPEGISPREIAERKFRDAARRLRDAELVMDVVQGLENEPNLLRLSGALHSSRSVHAGSAGAN